MGSPSRVTNHYQVPSSSSVFAKVTIGQPCHALQTEELPCQAGRSLRFGSHPQAWGSTHIYRFDILSFDFNGEEDHRGVLRSRTQVNNLIEQEITPDLPPNRIVIGGFSQGGAMTLATGLTTPHKFAGLTVLSGWFTIKEKIKEVCGDAFALATESLTCL